jgi:glycerol-3-phosphate cytidylyltransferase-like family protein
LQIVIENKPDVICLGYDQRSFTQELEKKLAEKGLHPKIIRMKAHNPEQYKSSKIRDKVMK